MSILVGVIVSLAISLAVALLTPKPKVNTPAAQQMEDPTADAGRPIPVVFGTVTVKSPNILGFWDKSVRQYKVKS